MRFAYIDSQGNEVSIPSVDALALRVELGAIGPDTQLYDAQADRWGPAHTHEIFHTLSRDTSGDRAFVAPPPPRFNVHEDLGLNPPEPEEAEKPEQTEEPEGRAEPGFLDLDFTLTDVQAGSPTPVPQAPADLAFDLDLTFSVPPSTPQPSDPPAEVPTDLASDLDLTFSVPPSTSQPPDAQAEVSADDAGSFDFGDWSTLEVEDLRDEEPRSQAPAAGETDPGAVDFDRGLPFEQMMSDFPSDSSPAWVSETTSDQSPSLFSADVESPGGGRPPFSGHGSGRGIGQHRASDEHARPRSRPSSPRPIRRTSPVGLIAGVIGIALLGGGAYFAYTTFGSPGGVKADGDAAPALPPVTIPTIPTALLPRMRQIGDAALGDMIDEFNDERQRSGLPAELDRAWLAGVYLAHASRYGDVKTYWEGLGSFVDHVRASDTKVFHDRYAARLERAGVAGDTATMLLARADSGFLAKREDRAATYGQMDDLVKAAVGLHAFLLLHEADIRYAPAAGGVSEDPVLEAVPATKELRDEMWTMVGRITSALDALGTLDRVTSERMSTVLFDRIRRAGFQ